MADLGSAVGPMAFAFGSALAGTAAAWLARASRRASGGPVTPGETGWGVALPMASVVLLGLLIQLQPHPPSLLDGLHLFWHRWEEMLHGSAPAHAALHGLNWLVLLAGLALGTRALFAFSRMRSFERTLRRCAVRNTDGTFDLPTPAPICFTLGVIRPTVYISTALREQLTATELSVVLAHESAHVRRRDPLKLVLATVFYTLFPLPGSRLLLQDWRHAIERACDQEVSRTVGDPCAVAAALVRVARLSAHTRYPALHQVCFADWSDDVEGRVAALLAQPATGGHRGATTAATLISVGVVLSAYLWLPHAVALFVHH